MLRHHGRGLLRHIGLDLARLEHGLDDEVRLGEPIVGGRRVIFDRIGVALRLREATALDGLGIEFRRVALALLGSLLRLVDEHHVQARRRHT